MTLPRSVGAVQGNEPRTVPSNQIFRSIRKLANTLVAYQIVPQDEMVLCDTSAGNNPNPSLPSNPEDGDSYTIRDGSGSASTTPITVLATGGKTIQGVASASINTNNGQTQFTYSKTLGYWLADSISNGGTPMLASTYFVAPQTGNDTTGDGTALRPFKRWSKVVSLIALASAALLQPTIPSETAVTVQFTESQTDGTDPVYPAVIVVPNTSALIVQGTFIRERTSAFTAVQNHVAGGNLQFLATGDFTIADQGKVVRYGVAPVNVAHVNAFVAGNQVRMLQPYNDGTSTQAVLVNLAAYEIGQYTTIVFGGAGAQWEAGYTNTAFVAFGDVTVQNVHCIDFNGFGTPVIFDNVVLRQVSFDFAQSVFPVFSGGNIFAVNCFFAGGFADNVRAQWAIIGGGTVLGGFNNHLAGALEIDGNFLVQGPGAIVFDCQAHSAVANMGGCDGAVFVVTAGCTVIFEQLFFTLGSIWGQWGAGGVGMFSIEARAAFVQNIGVPITTYIPVVGATVIFSTVPSAPAFDASVLPLTPYTALRTLSMANIAAAIGGGGFGGSVFDPRFGCYFGTA